MCLSDLFFFLLFYVFLSFKRFNWIIYRFIHSFSSLYIMQFTRRVIVGNCQTSSVINIFRINCVQPWFNFASNSKRCIVGTWKKHFDIRILPQPNNRIFFPIDWNPNEPCTSVILPLRQFVIILDFILTRSIEFSTTSCVSHRSPCPIYTISPREQLHDPTARMYYAGAFSLTWT